MSQHEGFVLRAPWYVRERDGVGLRDPRALRPSIQKYEGTDFVERLRRDPADSVVWTDDDRWSYPVPVALGQGTGRERFATSRLVHTGLRKLYQPSHSRFYAVVVELFCDAPGLPLAGSHDELEVGFVVRRQRTEVRAGAKPARRLAVAVLDELMSAQHEGVVAGKPDRDVRDVLWADCAHQRRVAEDHAETLAQVDVTSYTQAWVESRTGNRWRDVDEPLADGEREQEFRMWRLPGGRCEAATHRSLWFGLVPTFSADMSRPAEGERPEPKLDDQGVYEIVAFARRPPAPGHEHCPVPTWWSRPSEPYRCAAPYDPDGTKNHLVRIAAPDLRRLAARAGRPPGPGGAQISTPPGSGFRFDPSTIPGAGEGSIGASGGVCTFALELFFVVALFLFALFLPVVVFAFQLWWLLALKFCFPLPAALTFAVLEEFFAAGKKLADLPDTDQGPDKADRPKLDAVLGKDQVDRLAARPHFVADPTLFGAAVSAANGHDAVAPDPGEPTKSPPDPLCPGHPDAAGPDGRILRREA